MYSPTAWAEHVNNEIYQLVGLILQTAAAHNVTLGGDVGFDVPSERFALDKSRVGGNGAAPGALKSYSTAAIAGADNFSDDGATISDVFDLIVENTRKVTPTCESSVFR